MCAFRRCIRTVERDGVPSHTLPTRKHFQLGGLQGLDGQLEGDGLIPATPSTAKLTG